MGLYFIKVLSVYVVTVIVGSLPGYMIASGVRVVGHLCDIIERRVVCCLL